MMKRGTRAALTVLVVAAVGLPAGAPAVAAGAVAVAIDIRPGSPDATLNLKGSPALPVAILSTPSFAATTVDPASVCFGDPNNAVQRDCTESHGTGHAEDVDGDGDVDLLLHYSADEAGIDAGDTRGCLEGRTVDGTRIHGCDRLEVRNGTPESQPPDLTTALTAAPISVGPGDRVAWTATVTNEGVGATTLAPGDRLLRFTLPASLAAAAVTGAAAGYACTAASATVIDCATADPDTIDVAAARTFTLEGTMPGVPGPVSVTAAADPGGVVAESDESDNAIDAASVVEPSNLTAELTVWPGALSPGETATWTARVRNTGIAAARLPAGTTVLGLALPASVTPLSATAPAGWACALSSGTTYACSASAPATLAVGDELVFEVASRAPATAGLLTGTATADPAGTVVESDETDNAASADLLVEAPNLVASLVAPTGSVSAGSTVQWTATLLNVGPGTLRVPAGTRLLSLTVAPDLADAMVAGTDEYACAPLGGGGYACETVAPVTLFAGERDAFTLRATAPGSPGDVRVDALADPLSLVAEADETDNAASTTTAVTLSNLAISAVPDVDPVDAAGSARWTATIRNDGPARTVPSGTSFVRFSWPTGLANIAVSTPAGFSCFIVATDTADCATTTAVALPAGGTVPVTVFATAPREPGPVTLTFTVDPLAVLDESDETDNTTTATATVRPPDFSTTLTATPDPVDALATSTWVARITNDGPANARVPTGTRLVRFQVPSGMLNLAVSTPAGYTCALTATNVVDCSTTATTNIAAGSHVDVTLFGTAPRQPGPLTTTATADPLGAIPEGDETDNSATRTITVQPPDFSVALTATPDPVDALATSTWVARITNDGPANARVSTGTALVRFLVPTNMLNLAVSTPAGYTCALVATGTVDCSTTATTNIAAGSHVDVTLFGTAPRQPGPLSVTATADPAGAIPEGDEADNSATTTITVRPPDLSAALAGPTEVAAGATETWTATLANDGPANARLSTSMTVLRIALPAGLTGAVVTPPSGWACTVSGGTADCSPTATVNLPAGGSVAFTVSATAPATPQSLELTATADPLSAIPEADETDNVGVLTVTVV